MHAIKQGQEGLVKGILNEGVLGPQTAETIYFERKVSEASEQHIQLTLDQLVLAGCMYQTEDGRYLTSGDGERLAFTIDTTYSN
jgi:hypothetical protein